MHLCFVTICL